MSKQNQHTLSLATPFKPPFGLRNPHLQTILSSMGPRKLKIAKSLAQFESKQKEYVLDCGEGVRLVGALNLAKTKPSKKLVILVHGWEGSIKSSYIVSMTHKLLESGVDVFRLNMRDHGDTHHLNKKIFNATLINDVIGGVESIQRQLSYQDYYLVGFSLGGNFSLRVAALSHDRDISLKSVIAFCPPVHAGKSNDVLNERRNWLYGAYFVKKWKSSLTKKLEHFPEYEFANTLAAMKNLNEMNEQLIPRYTGFKSVDEYFNAYALNAKNMSRTICPCYLHFSKDDMIIPVQGASELSNNDNLHITVTEYGGHCGFLSNWKLDSWQDERALEIILS